MHAPMGQSDGTATRTTATTSDTPAVMLPAPVYHALIEALEDSRATFVCSGAYRFRQIIGRIGDALRPVKGDAA